MHCSNNAHATRLLDRYHRIETHDSQFSSRLNFVQPIQDRDGHGSLPRTASPPWGTHTGGAGGSVVSLGGPRGSARSHAWESRASDILTASQPPQPRTPTRPRRPRRSSRIRNSIRRSSALCRLSYTYVTQVRSTRTSRRPIKALCDSPGSVACI